MNDVIQINEEMVSSLVGPKEIFTVIEAMYASMYAGTARNFPVVREQLGHADAVYGFKSGFDRLGQVLGVKAGGYWPGNAAQGIANHQSTVLLFDPDTGMLKALVAGNRLTALRTAAAAAVSVKHLSNPQSETLSILGAGGQAPFQIRACFEQRPFKRIFLANRTRDKALALQAELQDLNVDIQVVSIQKAVEEANVLITIISSWEPVVEADWVSPGTHLVCMGTDTNGKQEVATKIVSHATLFCDEIEQVTTIGECQHAFASGDISVSDITPLGAVITDHHPGRTSVEEITLFDSTGVGLQDLVAAQRVLELWEAKP